MDAKRIRVAAKRVVVFFMAPNLRLSWDGKFLEWKRDYSTGRRVRLVFEGLWPLSLGLRSGLGPLVFFDGFAQSKVRRPKAKDHFSARPNAVE